MFLLGEGSEATDPFNKYANLFKYKFPKWNGKFNFGITKPYFYFRNYGNLHSTARSADILKPSNLAIIPQHITMVRLFLVHIPSIVNRDPDETKAIYIQYARQSSVSTFRKEVDEYCRHLWQREIKQGLMYSNYSGSKVRNSIMKMLAPYPKKISVKTLRVLMNDFEVREALFSANNGADETSRSPNLADDAKLEPRNIVEIHISPFRKTVFPRFCHISPDIHTGSQKFTFYRFPVFKIIFFRDVCL